MLTPAVSVALDTHIAQCVQTQTIMVDETVDQGAMMFDCAPTQYVIDHCGTGMSMRQSTCSDCF